MALFAFTNAWNEFLYALVYVYSNDAKTLTTGLTGMMMGDTFIWGQLMASSIIAIVPILIIYIVAQKYHCRRPRRRRSRRVTGAAGACMGSRERALTTRRKP